MDIQSIQLQGIGVFDSGIGGLTVANAIHSHLPNESIYYFGDTDRIPYGTKPASIILQYCLEVSQFLLEQSAKVIVVACNTATAAALPQLRATWPEIPFIGMEPAVKPAVKATRSGKIGVLATQTTFSSPRYQSLLERFAKPYQCFEDPCIGLVELIEAGRWSNTETERLLRSIIEPMLAEGVDTLVLGCTHYPFVEPLIKKIAGPTTEIINPAPAIARRLAQILTEHNWLNQTAQPGKKKYWVSGNKDALQKALKGLDLPLNNIYRFQAQ
ncbi:MAG: glutamate racemase [Saprospiraceae bacterium]|nr:glutamate racemase [Saprospiraceae bacterium]